METQFDPNEAIKNMLAEQDRRRANSEKSMKLRSRPSNPNANSNIVDEGSLSLNGTRFLVQDIQKTGHEAVINVDVVTAKEVLRSRTEGYGDPAKSKSVDKLVRDPKTGLLVSPDTLKEV